MTAITHTTTSPLPNHLRPFQLQKDLLPVANLVEACFSSTLDTDGRRFIQQMRYTARNPKSLYWASHMALSGYVWEEDHQIVGNLSLVPVRKNGGMHYLLANIAVAPAYRRRGIARALTQAGIEYVRRKRSAETWLQVRQNNTHAIALYRSLGFITRAVRTEWRRPWNAQIIPHYKNPNVRIRPQTRKTWPQERLWLKWNYPSEVSWYLNVDISAYQPGLIGWLYRLVRTLNIRQWSAVRNGHWIGSLVWQQSHGSTDHIWLATDPKNETIALPALINAIPSSTPYKRTLSLDYPAERATDLLYQAGFQPRQTLLWMRHALT